MNATHALNPTRCVKAAWELTGKAPVAIWVAGLVIVLVEGGPSAWEWRTEVNGGPGRAPGILEGFAFSYWISALWGISLLVSAVTAWLRFSYFRGIQKLMRSGTVELAEMYGTDWQWVPFFLATLLHAVLMVVAGAPFLLVNLLAVAIAGADGATAAVLVIGSLLYLPIWIYIVLGLVWIPYSVALDGVRPLESIQRSWAMAEGTRLQIFLLSLTCVALVLLGLLGCCVGVFIAVIVIEIMWVEAYVQLTGGAGDASESSDDNSPPAEPSEAADDGWPEESAAAPASEPDPIPTVPDPEPGPFDPSAWRQGSDIPPLEEGDEE